MTTAHEKHRRWLVNLWREGFKPTKFSNIFSAHFEDSFLNRTDRIGSNALLGCRGVLLPVHGVKPFGVVYIIKGFGLLRFWSMCS